MACAQAVAGFCIEVFIEQHQISPMRVVEKLIAADVARAVAVGVRQE
jgi:hypothetical protein